MEEEEEFLEPPEVKYIDQEEFVNLNQRNAPDRELQIRWIDGFEENEKKWHKLLTRFIEPLPHRNNFGKRIVEKYARSLNAHGCETIITLIGEEKNRDLIFLRLIAPKKAGNCGNLPLMLKNVSEVTKAVNFASYIVTVMMQLGLDAEKAMLYTRQICPSRLQLLHHFHQNYRQLLELRLSHEPILRAFRYIKRRHKQHKIPQNAVNSMSTDIFALAPHVSMMALQVILQDWSSKIQHEKIIQIAHANSVQMRPISVKGDGFTVLGEALCSAIALGFNGAQQEIEDFDELLHSRATFGAAKEVFQIWKIVSKFERNHRSNANPQGFLISAQRLEEEAERMGVECTVMVETACKIRHLCGNQEEEIIKTLTDTVTRHPSLGPKMLKLAEKFGVEYEVDVLLQHICDPSTEEQKLHPSEPLWLKFVETQVKTVGKFGSVRNTLLKLLKVMFEFLDFDTNRFNEKAWKLMKKVLELSDPSFVRIEWESRKDWWPEYQKSPSRNGRKMTESGEMRRKEVLEALEDL